jgi:alginate O-acetyltransferase complex protein AlgI
MVFSSPEFLYYFLPIVLGLYFIAPFKLKNFILLAASLFFYFYGEQKLVIVMIISSVSGYLHGLWIGKMRNSNSKYAKIPLISSVVVSLGFLIYYKYTDFFIRNINSLLGTNLKLLRIVLPIGISFYTFQILSYTFDVYMGKAKVQHNLLNFITYVTLFPQLIAGPIVRYTTIENELACRRHSFENFSLGVRRFVIGLSKKVLLANTLAEFGKIFTYSEHKSVLFYWFSAFAFMLQIYFDFSGYSDMAIGLGKMFGFHFLENFNYPYISKSISEFWRRWHISLGTWFRDYVYIPMGGNRVSKLKWIRNIIVVWFLTGFWHGAEWNFIVWGLYFSIFLVLEKFIIKKLLDKLPAVTAHIYTLFFITISFVIFNSDGMTGVVENLKGMLGLLEVPFSNSETIYYIRNYGFVMIVAAIAATPLITGIICKFRKYEKAEKIINILEVPVVVFLLLVITGYMVDGSFNPFIYFRF